MPAAGGVPTGDVVPAGVRAPRLVATDLDGTLLTPDGTLSARSRNALASSARAGITVVAVTARPPRWLTGLAPLLGSSGFAICANGAAVVQLDPLRVVLAHTFDDAAVRRLVAQVRQAAPAVRFALERTSGFAAEDGFEPSGPVPDGSVQVPEITEALDGGTIKVLARSALSIDLDLFVGTLSAAVGDAGMVTHSGAGGLAEVAPAGVTKASTLAAWAAERGVAAGEVWAVGDAPNDLPMLGWAGTSFAVSNAHPAVLADVDGVLPSNTEDGVAALLEAAVALTTAAPGPRRDGADVVGL